jgi:hypothetical protein
MALLNIPLSKISTFLKKNLNICFMKKISTLFSIAVLFASSSVLSAQANFKRYVMLEHFTNTHCSNCASQNPSFFTRISVETNADLHHMTIHPSYPSANCIFHAANVAEQTARFNYYGIAGTPRAVVNGSSSLPLSSVTAASLATEAATKSVLNIKVSEATAGANKTATVTLTQAGGTIPTAESKLFVVVVEKKISYTGPNGEATHYNVFRKLISPATGTSLSFNAQGVQTTTFDYTPSTAWNAANIYVLAYVQNTTSKLIYNSGTRFDLPPTGVKNLEISEDQVQIAPNPTEGNFQIRLDNNLKAQKIEILNTAGQQVYAETNNNSVINVNLTKQPKGVYLVRIYTEQGTTTRKILKD